MSAADTTEDDALATEPAIVPDRRLRVNGTWIMALFALAWTLGAASPHLWQIGGGAAALTLAIGVFGTFHRRSDTAMRTLPPDWARRFNRIGAVQGALIAIVCAVTIPLGMPMLIPTLVALIVAGHFVPLARVFAQRLYLVTAAALGAVAVAGAAVYAWHDPRASMDVSMFGAAVVLWASASAVAMAPAPDQERRA